MPRSAHHIVAALTSRIAVLGADQRSGGSPLGGHGCDVCDCR